MRADAERGRIYLPRSELARFNISEDDILRLRYTERFYELASDVARHARSFYQRAREILPEQDRGSMAAAELMGSVYWRLLRKLELQRFDVFGPNPTRVSSGQKLLLILPSGELHEFLCTGCGSSLAKRTVSRSARPASPAARPPPSPRQPRLLR